MNNNATQAQANTAAQPVQTATQLPDPQNPPPNQPPAQNAGYYWQTVPHAGQAPPHVGQYAGPYAGQIPKEKERIEFTKAEVLLGPLMMVCGFLFWEWLAKPESALGVFGFTALLIISTLCYFWQRGVKHSWKSRCALGVLVLFSFHFLIFDDTYIRFYLLMFLSSAYLYWVAVAAGVRVRDSVSSYAVFDLINQWIIAPIYNLPIFFKSTWDSLVKKKGGKNVALGICGLILFLPLTGIVVSFLTSADDAFMSFWDNISKNINFAEFEAYIFDFILGIPVAAYLFGSLFSAAWKRRKGTIREEGVETGLKRVRFAPGALLYAPLALFNLLYLLFFVALGNYLFSAMSGALPETFTYAEYARKGFFELCYVATINLCLIAAVYLFSKRDGKPSAALRILTGLMSLFTVLLVVTAMSKMLMYISSYGLTRLRIYTTAFMVLLLLLFLLVFAWHIKRFSLAGPLACVFLLFMGSLAFGNGDGVIAKYNLDQYAAGRLPSIDYVTLAKLSDGAAPYVHEAYLNAGDEVEKAALREVMGMLGRYTYAYNDQYFDQDDYGSRAGLAKLERPVGMLSDDPEGAKYAFQKWNFQSYYADRLRQNLR